MRSRSPAIVPHCWQLRTWPRASVSASRRHSRALPLRARFYYLKIRANVPIDFAGRDTFDIMRSSRAVSKHSVTQAQQCAERFGRSARDGGAARARSQTCKSHADADGVSTPGPPWSGMHWREIGPALPGGRVTSVAGSATDVQLYYLGSAGGGVWKSHDGGETWEPVFEKQAVSAIGAVTIDPTNNDVVWVGTGESNPRNDVSYGRSE